MARLLHTESSNGWGGQEIRILREAEGMRDRGHEVFFAVQRNGKLVDQAKAKGFIVYEINFKKYAAFATLPKLLYILYKHKIDLVNTHSSLDAWFGGIAARIAKKKVLRTRHLSTPIRKGLNSRLLYKTLADFVVTTSSSIIPMLSAQAKISEDRCECIATGIDPQKIQVNSGDVEKFRKSLNLSSQDLLVGTVCFVRSWKGVKDFLKAAQLLKSEKNLRWAIIGGGYLDEYKPIAKELGVEDIVTFTGHLESPYAAISALDIFTLLSTGHEGISQASLQAGFLQKPMVTTTIGGLPEVCIEGKTGILVPPFSPEKVAEAVIKLKSDPDLRKQMGENAKLLVVEKFTYAQMLDSMEAVYRKVMQ